MQATTYPIQCFATAPATPNIPVKLREAKSTGVPSALCLVYRKRVAEGVVILDCDVVFLVHRITEGEVDVGDVFRLRREDRTVANTNLINRQLQDSLS